MFVKDSFYLLGPLHLAVVHLVQVSLEVGGLEVLFISLSTDEALCVGWVVLMRHRSELD